jgi:hypothetical protein
LGQFSLVVLEVSSATIRSWISLVERARPLIREGGRIILFWHENSVLRTSDLNEALAQGPNAFDTLRLKGLSVAAVHPSRYQSWLEQGYGVALGYGRLRRPGALIKGTLLLPLVTTLTACMNVTLWASSRMRALGPTCSSVTVRMEAQPTGAQSSAAAAGADDRGK